MRYWGVCRSRWHRPGNAKDELWDLLVYGHAAVDIVAKLMWVDYLEAETVDMAAIWDWTAEYCYIFLPGPDTAEEYEAAGG